MGDDIVGRAFYELSARDDKLDANLRDAEGKIKASGKAGADHFEKSYTGASQKVSASFGGVRTALAGIGLAIGLTTVMSFFGGAIGAASDLNEEVNKSQVVFGQSAGAVEDFGARADRALGQSKQEALAAMGGFGNMFRTIGLGDETAAHMSITLDQLASDMASFNNADPSDMLLRLRSGLAGEAEPLRIYGVLLSEARVQQEAYASGIAEVGTQLTEAQKVQARYSLILKDTTLQQGDFARTSTGLANTERINAAIWQNSLAKIGAALLPLAKDLSQFASDVLPGVADSILVLVSAAGPLLGLFLEMGKLFLQYSVVILPALALWFGVKLVAAFKAAQLAGVTSGVEVMAAWAPVLLAFELMNLQGSLNDTSTEWGKLQEIAKDPIVSETLNNMGVSAAQFALAVEAAGGDVHLAFENIKLDARKADTDLQQASDDAMNGVAGKFRAGKDVIAQAMYSAVTPVTEEMKAARQKAYDEAHAIPGDIAKALISGQADVESGMKALTDLMETSLSDAAKIARLKGVLSSKELAAGLLDERADVRASAMQIRDDALAQLNLLKTGTADAAVDAGVTFAEQLRLQSVAAGTAAADVRSAAMHELKFAAEAGTWGSSVGASWSDGLVAGLATNIYRAQQKLYDYKLFLMGRSPPQSGPLKDIDKWGYNVGASWAAGVAKGISATGVLDALGGPGALVPAMAGTPGGTSANRIDGRMTLVIEDRNGSLAKVPGGAAGVAAELGKVIDASGLLRNLQHEVLVR